MPSKGVKGDQYVPSSAREEYLAYRSLVWLAKLLLRICFIIRDIVIRVGDDVSFFNEVAETHLCHSQDPPCPSAMVGQ